MKDEVRATTIRLPPELAEELKMIAKLDGKTVSEVIRVAIANWLDKRSADPAFRARLQERIENDKRILERLRQPGDTLDGKA